MTSLESPLDIALLDENAEMGIDGLRELLDMYLVQADEILGGLRKAVADGSAKDVDQMAHKLAGSSAVCGVNVMVAPLRDLEKQGRAGDLNGADELVQRIDDQLDLSRRLLAEYLAGK
jgi:HPt (histidine-containing phosphotransfer) domain-containing protein